MTILEPNRRFVQTAWALLLAQLVAAALALAVTGWAILEVRPLLAERQRLEIEIARGTETLDSINRSLEGARRDLKTVEVELKGARLATPELVAGINAYHKKEFKKAIAYYLEAIRLNPGDAYTYNLMSYSQFKTGDYEGAISTMSKSLNINPSYDWGYFDLARYQCAAGKQRDALTTVRKAIETRGDSVKSLARDTFLTTDGEFLRLCASIVPEIRQLSR